MHDALKNEIKKMRREKIGKRPLLKFRREKIGKRPLLKFPIKIYRILSFLI
jgi:hypothetical protein